MSTTIKAAAAGALFALSVCVAHEMCIRDSPKLDGREVLALIKEDSALKSIPTVVLLSLIHI